MSDERGAARARWSVALVFLAFGLVVGAWTSRLPAVREQAGLSDHELSLALVALAAGCVLGMAVVGRQLDRLRRPPVRRLAVGLALLLPLAALAGSLAGLCLCLLGLGAAQGTLNVAMNARATRVEADLGRPILSGFHAVFSIGGLLGAGVGAATAAASVPPLPTFGLVGALVVCAAGASLAAGGWTSSPEAPVATVREARGRGVPSPTVVLLGVVVLIAMIGEGAAADWAAVYLEGDRHASASLAAGGFAAFSSAMLAGRLVGDSLVARFGPVVCVRSGAAVAVVGLSLGLLAPSPIGAIAGFAAFGLGLSPITPQVYSAIGRRASGAAARDLSVVVGLGYTGFLLGPAVIGFVSAGVGLRMALGVPAILLLLVVVCAGSVAAGSPARPIARRLGSEPSP